jgi:hypothetical protein
MPSPSGHTPPRFGSLPRRAPCSALCTTPRPALTHAVTCPGIPAAAQPSCFHRPDPGPSPCTGRQPGPPAPHATTGPFPCFRWSRPAPHAPGPPARPTHGPRSYESSRPLSVSPPTQSGSVASGPAALMLSPARSGPPGSPGPPARPIPGSRSPRLIPVRPPTQAGSVCTRPSPAQLLSLARSGPLPMHRPTARPTRTPRSHWPIPVLPLVPSGSPCTRPASPAHPRPTLP